MGSLGYCVICNGENCTRGAKIICISCGRPKEEKVEPAKDLDQLLVGAAVGEPLAVTVPSKRRR